MNLSIVVQTIRFDSSCYHQCVLLDLKVKMFLPLLHSLCRRAVTKLLLLKGFTPWSSVCISEANATQREMFAVDPAWNVIKQIFNSWTIWFCWKIRDVEDKRDDQYEPKEPHSSGLTIKVVPVSGGHYGLWILSQYLAVLLR